MRMYGNHFYKMNSTPKVLPGLWLMRFGFLLPLVFTNNCLAAATASKGVDSLYLLKLVLALIFVLAIFLILAKVVRQMNGVAGASASGPLSIVASLSVGARERIVILQVGEEQLLVGISPSGIVKLQDLDTPVVTDGVPLSNSFKSQLNNILGDRFK